MSASVTILFRNRRRKGVKKRTFTLQAGQPFVVGRSFDADLTIDDKNISRTHCVLRWTDGGLSVEDTSRNGTRLNKTPIEAPHPIDPDDVLKIGETLLKFTWHERGQTRSMLPLIGREIDGLRFERLIGKGNLGVVYRAIQTSINRPVAVKTLPPDHLSKPSMIERFRQQAWLAGRLAHPNIVKVFSSGQLEQQGLYYVVMELVQGDTLSQVLSMQPALPIDQALSIVEQIGSALAYGHQRHIIHRDVNPDNIMLTEGGLAKLVGLGLAKSLKDEDQLGLTMAGKAMGRIRYSPPEQVKDASTVDQRADVFGLGAVFYRMVTGVPPLPRSKRELFEQIKDGFDLRPAHELNEELSEEISEVISKTLRFDPEERYQSIDDLLDAVAEVTRPQEMFTTQRVRSAKRNLLAMLPSRPEIDGFRFATLFSPCEEIGGDFYDFFSVSDTELGVVLGDVAGHGIEAAVVVGMAKTLCQLLGAEHGSPADALSEVNDRLMPQLSNTSFVTILMAIIDHAESRIRFCRAGHPPLLRFNPARDPVLETYEPSGTVVGMLEGEYFRQEELTLDLRSGDTLLMYTDGLVEAMSADREFFGPDRLAGLLAEHAPEETLDELVMRIRDAVEEWGAEQADDMTLIAIGVD